MVRRKLKPKCANHASHAVQAVAVVKGKAHALRRTAERKAVAKANAAAHHAAANHAAMTADHALHVRHANNVRTNRARNAQPELSNHAARPPHVAKADSATAVAHKGHVNNAQKDSARTVLSKLANLAKASRHAKASQLVHKVNASRNAQANVAVHVMIVANVVTIGHASLAHSKSARPKPASPITRP